MSKKSKPTTLPTLYKILSGDQSCHGGNHTWSLPTADSPGEWQEVKGKLVRCSVGFHLTTHPYARHHGDETNAIYLVEVDQTKPILPPDHDEEEWVVSRVRLLRKMEGEELQAALHPYKPFPPPPHLYIITHDGKCCLTYTTFPLPNQGPGDWVDVPFDATEREGGIRLTQHPQHIAFREGVELFEAETEGPLYVDRSGNIRAARARLARRVPPSEMKRMGIGVEKQWKRGRAERGWKEIQKYEPRGLSPAERFIRTMVDHVGVDLKKNAQFDSDAHIFETIKLAILSGLEFRKATPFHDAAASSAKLEELYSIAVSCGNESATKAIENVLGRTPWVWSGERLSLGSEMFWRGRMASITRINDGEDTIRLVVTEKRPHTRGKSEWAREMLRTTVSKRWLVTREEFDVVAPRYVIYLRRAKLVDALVQRIKNKNFRINAISIWFWTKEDLCLVEDWLKMLGDKQTHRKSRIVVDMPTCIQQALADAQVDAIARQKIDTAIHKQLGPYPKSEDFGHKSWEWSDAVNVWDNKRATMRREEEGKRDTEIGRMARAVQAWQEANLEGHPSHYLSP